MEQTKFEDWREPAKTHRLFDETCSIEDSKLFPISPKNDYIRNKKYEIIKFKDNYGSVAELA